MLSASSRRRWFNRGDVPAGVGGDILTDVLWATGIVTFHFLVAVKAGAHKDKPGIQQRERLLDRLCLGDQRLEGTPVADYRQATTGTAWKGANHV